MKKKSNGFIYTKIIISIFLICAIFFMIGVILYFWLDNNYPEDKNEIITIYSAVVGGLCTLFGVILTISFAASDRAKDFKYEHMPRIFMPTKYNIAKAIRIIARCDDDGENLIPNHIIYFQNTDKIEFKLVSFYYCNEEYQCNPSFVSKNELFSICFYSKDYKNDLVLNIEGLDGVQYIGDVDIEKNSVSIKEKS